MQFVTDSEAIWSPMLWLRKVRRVGVVFFFFVAKRLSHRSPEDDYDVDAKTLRDMDDRKFVIYVVYFIRSIECSTLPPSPHLPDGRDRHLHAAHAALRATASCGASCVAHTAQGGADFYYFPSQTSRSATRARALIIYVRARRERVDWGRPVFDVQHKL